MKTKKSLLAALFALTFLSLINSSCSSEHEITKDTHKTAKKIISLAEFKQETGLKNFSTTIRVPRNMDSAARAADGSYALSDFQIDTEQIKKLTIDEKTTYTFLVRPKIIEAQSFFNLVMYYQEGEWQSSIVELKPSPVNWDALKDNPDATAFQGTLKMAYKSQTLINIMAVGDCQVIVIANLHCSGFSVCAAGCDGCTTGEDACMTLTQFSLCPQNLNSYIAPIDDMYNGGAGSGPPVILDPSGYVFDPMAPMLGPVYQRIQRASMFWNQLTQEEQQWAHDNSDQYCEMLEYTLNNYSAQMLVDMREFLNYMKGLPPVTQDDYPGKNNGLGFEWWLDEEQVTSVMQYEYPGWGELTAAEKRLVVIYKIPAYAIKQNVQPAFNACIQKFGNFPAPQGLNDKIDAFRHAYFLAINTRSTTKFWAKMFSDAHESEVPAGLIKEKNMDLYNNQKGIDYAVEQSQATPTQLINMIYDLMNYGYLVYLSPLDWTASPYYDFNNNDQQDCNACFNGITTQTQTIYTNQ
jgi:hypothetical protein